MHCLKIPIRFLKKISFCLEKNSDSFLKKNFSFRPPQKNFFSSQKKSDAFKNFFFPSQKIPMHFQKNFSFCLEKNFFPSLKKFRCVFQKNLFPFFEKSLRASDKKICFRHPKSKAEILPKNFPRLAKKIPCLTPEKNPSRKIFCKKKSGKRKRTTDPE